MILIMPLKSYCRVCVEFSLLLHDVNMLTIISTFMFFHYYQTFTYKTFILFLGEIYLDIFIDGKAHSLEFGFGIYY